jgi:hypothetical protein
VPHAHTHDVMLVDSLKSPTSRAGELDAPVEFDATQVIVERPFQLLLDEVFQKIAFITVL